MPQTPGPRAIGFSPPRPDISGVIPITRAQSNGIIPPIDAAVYNRPPPSRRGSEERQPFPPGLSTSPQGISPSAAAGPAYPPIRRERRESFSVPPPARPNGGPGPSAVGRGDVRVEDPSGVRSAPPAPASRIVQPPTMLNRRPSLGARDAPSYIRPQPAPIQVSTRVRFDENLICPSPIPFHERRKGWFNARGDQLWTNLGAYKPAPAGQEYPTDLRHYPDYGSGWMNEECVRIDMQHRLVPKVPLRSALKKSRSPSDGNGVY
ncbi:hypothetical protein FA95DRAFT_1484348 [Auriscalpium vulgare]|uniref:Uncharacterized protein n=1 Tax=Auriscalpium vulgare TaxID=40419 RepID=A0ACB8S7B7_9AGAM|nr:hypothetical protein FA95DRAFT_1484348 [Auriscalpium vulgare]